jgi:hypothetical protein
MENHFRHRNKLYSVITPAKSARDCGEERLLKSRSLNRFGISTRDEIGIRHNSNDPWSDEYYVGDEFDR